MNKTLAVLLITTLASTTAFAQSYAAKPYIGGGVGAAFSDVARDFGDAYYSRVGSSDESATGYKLYGGVLWGNWGVEIGYYDFGSYTVEGGANNSVSDKFGTTAYAISAVGSWPVSRVVTLTGKLGIAPAKTKYECLRGCAGISGTEKSSTGVLFSFGVGWNVSPNVMLTASLDALGGVKAVGYSAPNRQEEATYGYGMLSVGVEARF